MTFYETIKLNPKKFVIYKTCYKLIEFKSIHTGKKESIKAKTACVHILGCD